MLESIYGRNVVASLVNSPNYEYVKLKAPKEIEQFIKTYVRLEDESCQEQKCKKLLSNESFSERKMDFPSWLGSLDFKNKHGRGC